MLCELILKSETKTQLKVFVVPLNNIEAMEPERNACLRSHDKAPALLPTLGSGSGTMHLTQRGAKGIAKGRREEERVCFLRVPLRDPSRPLRLDSTPPPLAPTFGSDSGTMHLTQRDAKGIAEGRRGEERVFFLRVPLRDPSRPLRLNGTPPPLAPTFGSGLMALQSRIFAWSWNVPVPMINHD